MTCPHKWDIVAMSAAQTKRSGQCHPLPMEDVQKFTKTLKAGTSIRGKVNGESLSEASVTSNVPPSASTVDVCEHLLPCTCKPRSMVLSSRQNSHVTRRVFPFASNGFEITWRTHSRG